MIIGSVTFNDGISGKNKIKGKCVPYNLKIICIEFFPIYIKTTVKQRNVFELKRFSKILLYDLGT